MTDAPTILVTGATSGIGRQTASLLARQGARVMLHGRDPERTLAAAREIVDGSPDAKVTPVFGDFASLGSIRALASQVHGLTDRLDVLIHNAGTYEQTRRLTIDGIETTFQVDHLAPFLLTHLLVGQLRAAAPSRVVTVSSSAHFRAVLDFENLQGELRYEPYEAYALAKLGNVMFAFTLAERLRDDGVTSNVLHPGTIGTDMLHEASPNVAGGPLARGAANEVRLATAPEMAFVTGEYFDEDRPTRASELAYDRGLRARLWQISERLTGITEAGRI
jgi:NAD(P)-dependent dehydrogenase (short-subunit alcohol dehydrogenase family)